MSRAVKQTSLSDIQEKYSSPDAVVSPQILRQLQRDSRSGARKLYQALLRRWEEQTQESKRIESMLHFERVLWKAGRAARRSSW